MTRDEITARLTTIFRDIFREPGLVVTDALTAKDVKRWDSLSHIDMIVLVEEEFGVRFRTGEISDLANVGELIDLIAARVG